MTPNGNSEFYQHGEGEESTIFNFDEWVDVSEQSESIESLGHKEAVFAGPVNDAGFDFDEWLKTGGKYGEGVLLNEPNNNGSKFAIEEWFPDNRLISIIKPHPIKTAIFILFFSAAVLVILSVLQYIPPLGPATGF